jgi:FkbM family methyltransferase
MNTMLPQHPIFDKFTPWHGRVQPGYWANFLGVMTRNSFVNFWNKPLSQEVVTAPLPAFSEEYFEWIDVLEAAVAAEGHFTMIELGAGYGRWMANAVAALRAVNDLPYTLIGVEPEPTHFKWMEQHFEDNGIDFQRTKLIEAAVAADEGSVWFYVGRPAEWYGQAIAPTITGSAAYKLFARLTRRARLCNEEVRKVPAVSLNTILRPLSTVDLIDLDVQGAELEVLTAAKEQLAAKVKRVHIGTHSTDIEAGLRTLFNNLEWKNLNDYSIGSEPETPYGKIKFGDGVQTWVNKGLPGSRRAIDSGVVRMMD